MSDKPKPSNFGARWNDDQEAWLLRAVAKSTPISEISQKMDRTPGSIVSRLHHIACGALDSGKSMDDACLLTGLTASAISDGRKKRDERAAVAAATKAAKKLAVSVPLQAVQVVAPVAPVAPMVHVALPAATTALNEEQQQVLRRTEEGRNVFLTGGAGVGKSYTVKYIIDYARKTGRNLGVCGMTGSAAILIEGTTLHSFMGIGLAKECAETLVLRIQRMPPIYNKLKNLDMLLIDEVSMLNNELFDKVSAILGIIRRRQKEPFGGVQMILVGDMCQIAPIEGTYCFLAASWAASAFTVFLLTANMRQKDDATFKQMLDRLRWGTCSPADLVALTRLGDTQFPAGIVPTRLYARNADVDRVNVAELAKLLAGAGATEYGPKYKGDAEKRKRSKKWSESMKIAVPFTVCVGAQVVLTRNMNLETGLINGSRGVVMALTPMAVSVQFANGVRTNIDYYTVNMGADGSVIMDGAASFMEVAYIPLKLAWAISIHASQGMTLDALEIDLGASIFAHGQAYTGLSRARSLQSVRVVDVVPCAFKTHPAVVEFYKKANSN